MALPGDSKNYPALDAPGRDENGRKYSSERVERALKDVIAPKTLPLKVGAQVMLIKVRDFDAHGPAIRLTCLHPIART